MGSLGRIKYILLWYNSRKKCIDSTNRNHHRNNLPLKIPPEWSYWRVRRLHRDRHHHPHHPPPPSCHHLLHLPRGPAFEAPLPWEANTTLATRYWQPNRTLICWYGVMMKIYFSCHIVTPDWPEKSQLKDRKLQEAEGASFSYLLNDITFLKWCLLYTLKITFDTDQPCQLYCSGYRSINWQNYDVLTQLDTAGTPSPTCCFQTTCYYHVWWSTLVYWSSCFMIMLTIMRIRSSCRMRITEEQWDRCLVLMMIAMTTITIVTTLCSLVLTTKTTTMIAMMMVMMMMMMMMKHLWSPNAVWCCIFQKCIGTPILHLASF